MVDKLLAEMSRLADAGEVFAVATITASEGSSPRHIGSKMIVRADGSIVGSIGGGAVEKYVHGKAKHLMKHRVTETIDVDLSKQGMVCGGKVTVFIETHGPVIRLVICGGGHIGAALADMGDKMGIPVWVADDRPDFCNEERFPQAERLFCGPYTETVPTIPLDPMCAVVIVTHGHAHDFTCLRTAVESDAGYIGMIGSRNKARTALKRLRRDGVSEEAIAKVRAPIGLDVGAESPYEITVAIFAEMLNEFRGGTGRPMREVVVEEVKTKE